MAGYDLAVQALARAVPSVTGWWRTKCPYCVVNKGTEDRHASMSIRVSTGWYQCWRCEEKGRIPDRAIGPDLLHRARADEARTQLARGTEQEPFVPPDRYEPLWSTETVRSRRARVARTYLYQRRVPDSIMADAQIGYVPGHVGGRWANRIIVPVTRQGRWLGYVGRIIPTDGAPAGRARTITYLYPAGFRRADALFNGDALDTVTDEPVIVVEGIFDALPLWPDAVACLGKPANNHIALLARASRPVVVALDGDAWRDSVATCTRLKLRGVEADWIRLPSGEDPGSMGADWIRQELRHQLPSVSLAAGESA